MAGASTSSKKKKRDDKYLVQYLAKYNADGQSRRGRVLYETLVQNERKKWPWAGRHSAESWRTHYCENQEYFDKRINQLLKKQSDNPDHFQSPPPHEPIPRVGFTVEDEQNLIKYLANNKGDRSGNKLYQDMVGNATESNHWTNRHPWSAWRDRYVKHSEFYDRKIEKYLNLKLAMSHPSQEVHPERSDTERRARSSRKEQKRKRVSNSQDEDEDGIADSPSLRKSKRPRLRQAEDQVLKPSSPIDLTGDKDTDAPSLGEFTVDPTQEIPKVSQTDGHQVRRSRVTKAVAGGPRTVQAEKKAKLGGPPDENSYAGDIFISSEESDDDEDSTKDENEVENVVVATPEDSTEGEQTTPQDGQRSHSHTPDHPSHAVRDNLDDPRRSRTPQQKPPTRAPSPPTGSDVVHHPFSEPPSPTVQQSQLTCEPDAVPPKVLQGPTPPTSDVAPSSDSPRPSPHAATSLQDLAREIQEGLLEADRAEDSSHESTHRKDSLKRRDSDTDFFQSSPSSARGSGQSSAFPRMRQPPRLSDGPFSNVLTTGSGRITQTTSHRRTSDIRGEEQQGEFGEGSDEEMQEEYGQEIDDEDQLEDWPPLRHQKQDEGINDLFYDVEEDPSQRPHHAFSQPTQPQPREASPSQDRDEASPPEAGPSHSNLPFTQFQIGGIELEDALATLAKGCALVKPDSYPDQQESAKSTSEVSETDLNDSTPEIPSQPVALVDDPDSRRIKDTRDRKGKQRAFVPQMIASLPKRRHTFGGSLPREVEPQPRDLVRQRQLPPSRQSVGKGSNDRSIHPTTPAGVRPQYLGISVSEEDLNLAFDTILRKMADNHGQSLHAAQVIWSKTQSLLATDKGLLEMRLAAEEAGIKFLESFHDADSEPDRENENDAREPVPGPSGNVSGRRELVRVSTSGFQYTPLKREEVNNFPSPKYKPPRGSRAAKLTKSMRKGKKKEVLGRDQNGSVHTDQSARDVDMMLSEGFGRDIQEESSLRRF